MTDLVSIWSGLKNMGSGSKYCE